MQQRFMQVAIELALLGIEKGNGPFGAVVVKGDEVVGLGTNRVTSSNDPTAHAEICAIRNACENLKTFNLAGLEIYTSCEPCPMCLGSIYWARLDRIYYGTTQNDAAKINFDDHKFYEEIAKPPHARAIPTVQLLRDESIRVFETWERYDKKVQY
jgi:guanine deaminase